LLPEAPVFCGVLAPESEVFWVMLIIRHLSKSESSAAKKAHGRARSAKTEPTAPLKESAQVRYWISGQ
jgi:hypothetical protein